MNIFNRLVFAGFALGLWPGAVTTIIPSRGFNMALRTVGGACKTASDWEQDLETIKSWRESSHIAFNAIKLFSCGECDALTHVVPVAQKHGFQIWAGIWAEDEDEYRREIDALETAVRTFGAHWLTGINVGSEYLQERTVDEDTLVGWIYATKRILRDDMRANVRVGTVDTNHALKRPEHIDVILACDVVSVNIYGYWASSTCPDAGEHLRGSVAEMQSMVPGRQITIGELGWPSEGGAHGAATPTVANLQRFWKDAACWLNTQPDLSWFWFEAFDEPAKEEGSVGQHWGVADQNRKLKIDLSC